MVGWCISVGIGAAAGVIIGLIYRCTNGNFEHEESFFNDNTLFSGKGKRGEDTVPNQ
jgi:hypothetical protein